MQHPARKLIALLFVTVMVFGLITGCTQPSAAPQATEAPAAPPAAETNQAEATPAEPAKTAIKAALLLPGEITDMGWNTQGYNGLMRAKDELGAEVRYSEKVSDSDAEEYFRSFANDGFDIVIGHGAEYADAAKKAATLFPNTTFVVTSVNAFQAPNMGAISNDNAQQGFLAGVLAAAISQTGNVGYIGGREIVPVIEKQKNSELGAKWVNPDIKYNSIITGSYDDLQKAQECAMAMIEQQGCDVIIANADKATMTILDICKEKGVKCIGMGGKYTKDYADIQPANVINDAATCIFQAVKMKLDGTFKPEYVLIGVAENAVYVEDYQPWVSETAKEWIEKAKTGLTDGSIEVTRVS